MATSIITFRVTYQGLEDKIWRKVQVSSNYHLNQLGYLVLAAFDTMAYHLFDIEHEDDLYELPNEDSDLDEILDIGFIRLFSLKLNVGDTLTMTYDFGLDQVFDMQVLSIEPMPKGTSTNYPLIADGAGCGIIDDMHVSELAELIEQIDANGHTDEPIYYFDRETHWDYRQFDLAKTNKHLKSLVRKIQDGYAPFWEAYAEE